MLQRYSAQGAEPARQAASEIFGLQNSLKAFEGREKGLLDPQIMDAKRKEEDGFPVEGDGESRVETGVRQCVG